MEPCGLIAKQKWQNIKNGAINFVALFFLFVKAGLCGFDRECVLLVKVFLCFLRESGFIC